MSEPDLDAAEVKRLREADAIVRKLATEYADGTTAESMGVDDVYALARAYVEANPA